MSENTTTDTTESAAGVSADTDTLTDAYTEAPTDAPAEDADGNPDPAARDVVKYRKRAQAAEA